MPDFDLDAVKARQAAARAETAAAAADPDDDHRPPHLDPAAIAGCQQCDDDGYRRLAVCDHLERQDAARRGMEAIRSTMGWKPRDETRDEIGQPTNHPNHPPKTHPRPTQPQQSPSQTEQRNRQQGTTP